jgi:hypothetical protein
MLNLSEEEKFKKGNNLFRNQICTDNVQSLGQISAPSTRHYFSFVSQTKCIFLLFSAEKEAQEAG